jgi:hypothetical protein
VSAFVLRHDLDADAPLRKVTLRDGVEQIALRVVGILSLHVLRLFAGEVLDALLGLKVPLHVKKLILAVDQAEGVAAVTVHVPVAVRRAPVGEKNRHLMQRLGGERPEIPHHRGRFEVGFRIALLRVDEIAELERIANKENGRVVAHHVPVAFFRVKLQREPARISFGVR